MKFIKSIYIRKSAYCNYVNHRDIHMHVSTGKHVQEYTAVLNTLIIKDISHCLESTLGGSKGASVFTKSFNLLCQSFYFFP